MAYLAVMHHHTIRMKVGGTGLHRKDLRLLAVLVCLLAFVTDPTLAWGASGHAIVATIAQSLLHPAVRSHLCSILPDFTQYTSMYPREGAPHTHCHLAPLASWPDTAKWRMRWSGRYHYINPIDDDPPTSCAYGEHGWASQENLLTSMVNYTRHLKEARGQRRDEALRFVTHLVGDAHQPLHLTGRQRGGNDVHVRFEGKFARLHSVWDSQILNVQIRSLANYTVPLRSPAVESALQGQVYDAYMRWILAEGLGIGLARLPSSPASQGWWEDEWELWTQCPKNDGVRGAGSLTDDVDHTDLPLCPAAWTKPMHALVCQYAFASPVPRSNEDFDGDMDEGIVSIMRRGRRRRRPRQPNPPTPAPPGRGGTGEDGLWPELAVPEYLGKIEADKVIQKQLAKGGVRLAAILNSVLLPEAQAAESAKTNAPKYYIEEEVPGTMMVVWGHVQRVVRGRLVLWGF